MGKYILSALDFTTNSNAVTSNDSQDLIVKKTINSDFEVGIVSKGDYATNVGKSIVVDFEMDSRTFDKFNIIGDKTSNSVAYINPEKQLVFNGEVVDDYSDVNIDSIVKIETSDTNLLVVFNDGTYKVYGSDDNGQISNLPDNAIAIAALNGAFLVNVYAPESDDDTAPYKLKLIGNNDAVVIDGGDVESATPLASIVGNGNSYAFIRKDNTAKVVFAATDTQERKVLTFIKIDKILLSDSSAVLLKTDKTLINENVSVIETGVVGALMFDRSNGCLAVNIVRDNYLGSKIISGDNVNEFDDKFIAAINNYAEDGKMFIVFDDGSIKQDDGALVTVYQANLDTKYDFIKKYQPALIVAAQKSITDSNAKYCFSSDEQLPVLCSNGDFINNNVSYLKGALLTYSNKHLVGYSLNGNVFTEDKTTFLTTQPQSVLKIRLAISFTPFGKLIRLFQNIDGTWVELKDKAVSMGEASFDYAKVAIYIMNATNLTITSVEVTDEIDATLFPEKVIYRDLDTAILQTKVAESMETNKNVLKSQALLLKDIVETFTSKIDEINQAISKLINDVEELKNQISSDNEGV